MEVNSETDFVSRNEQFQDLVGNISRGLSSVETEGSFDLDVAKAAQVSDGFTVEDSITNIVSTMRENVQLRRATGMSVKDGVVAAYMHNALGSTNDNTGSVSTGSIGVLVGLSSNNVPRDEMEQLGRKVGHHILGHWSLPDFCFWLGGYAHCRG